MLFWRRLRQRLLIAATLYSIVATIVIARIIEVHELTVYRLNELTEITGIVATYSKIALGWC